MYVKNASEKEYHIALRSSDQLQNWLQKQLSHRGVVYPKRIVGALSWNVAYHWYYWCCVSQEDSDLDWGRVGKWPCMVYGAKMVRQ
jgi:hypothetical protein